MSATHVVPEPGPRLLPAVAVGFAAAVTMWVIWFVTHLPAIRFPPVVAGPLLLGVMLAALAAGVRLVPRAIRVRTGLGAGLGASGINLLVLGSKITQPAMGPRPGEAPAPVPGAGGVRPDAWLIVLGFLAVGALAGLAAGWFAAKFGAERPAREPRAWLMRFAGLTALATLPLVAVGGLVTSTASGLAVPDWPGTYGANMFLYPISLMADPRIYLEHTHRLFGSLVGLTTLTLLGLTLAFGPGRWAKVIAAGLFVGVCVQGIMGGLRVEAISRGLALAHGITAQMLLAGMVAFAATLTPGFAGHRPGVLAGRGRGLAGLLLGALLLQLTMGAMYRHLGSMHPLWAHVVFSVVVFGLAIIMGSWWIKTAREHPGDALMQGLRPVGMALHGVVGVQFLLGWAALALILLGQPGPRELSTTQVLEQAPPINPWLALVRTAHQANGAILLATATLASVWAWRLTAPRSGQAVSRGAEGAVAGGGA